MARFGRGQPHAPIYLRAPLIAAAVVAAFAPQIHIIGAQPPRAYRAAHVIYVRGAPSVVPPRLAPQFTIVLQRRGAPRFTQIVFTRTAAVAVVAPAAPAPQVHVVLTRRLSQPGQVVQLRAPMIVAVAPAAPAPQIHVVLARVARRPSKVVLLRGTSVVPPRLAPQITVVLTRRIARPVGVVSLRGAQPTVVVAAVPAPQIHVILTRRGVRSVQIVALHGAPSVVPPRLAPQIHIVLAPQRRGVGRVIQLRGGYWTPAPQIHIVLAPSRRGIPKIVQLRTVQPFVPPTAAGPQIHVVLQHQRPPATRIVIAGQKSVVPPKIATPQITVVLQTRRRDVGRVRDINKVRYTRNFLEWRIAGITRDVNGNTLGGCTVKLYRTADDVMVGTVISDVRGNYAFRFLTPPTGINYYVVAYLVGFAGVPDVAGTTVNTLVPL